MGFYVRSWNWNVNLTQMLQNRVLDEPICSSHKSLWNFHSCFTLDPALPLPCRTSRARLFSLGPLTLGKVSLLCSRLTILGDGVQIPVHRRIARVAYEKGGPHSRKFTFNWHPVFLVANSDTPACGSWVSGSDPPGFWLQVHSLLLSQRRVPAHSPVFSPPFSGPEWVA